METPPEPKCKSCHGFSLKNLIETGAYTEAIYKPPEDLIQQFDKIPGASFFNKPGKLSNNLLVNTFEIAKDCFINGN